MKSSEIRKAFLNFFELKSHTIVPSAPMVVKNDPTLMFTNAGMNQFKDLFLGNAPVKHPRVTDTQKCLRVSGKHNDLEEVGHDTYHHTMFEMLGNWSFGDYFKKEAIEWAWEFLTEVVSIDKNSLYVTVFEGDKNDKLESDSEAYSYWKNVIPESQILYGSKKDNFWEMGETGPCGPCSEVHIDIRSAEDKAKLDGKELVNKDHPQVIEVWNLVFIEFNRLSNGSLESLKDKHVDTGMGFERLCMVLQGVQSNYDTDVFTPLIKKVADLSGTTYGINDEKDIAMRVISDHLRAVSFAIADGALPSNVGAGYVIRRILRRAVRFGYTFLGFDEPFLTKVFPVLSANMSSIFPELKSQGQLIVKVIEEEEKSFLRTLAQGIKRFENYISGLNTKIIDGKFAFELFDTFGFPIDLTQLMAKEKGFSVDMEGFKKGLDAQKQRSKKAASVDTGDWIELSDKQQETLFVGYDSLETEVRIQKYREVISKKKKFFEIVLDKTPFYAESGGQVGDKGILVSANETIAIFDTKKENNLWIHYSKELPKNKETVFMAKVDSRKRSLTAKNHSATHLMHAALREVLGEHVEQKGSLVDTDRLRFDFSHFSKMTDEEIRQVEKITNQKIRENIKCDIKQNVPLKEAEAAGAIALFGEKYGDEVRVVTFNQKYSIELCGGTHVAATGELGLFKIISESGIAAGVRRIEAVTAEKAEELVNQKFDLLANIGKMFKNQPNTQLAVSNIIEENNKLQKQLVSLQKEKIVALSKSLFENAEDVKGIKFIAAKVDFDVNQAKLLAQSLRSISENIFVVLAVIGGDKVNLVVALSDELVSKGELKAGEIIKKISVNIKGGGGGQPHMATAGGKDTSGIDAAFESAKGLI